jgi:hypothetical protein
MLTLIPNPLMFGPMDHILHLILGAVFRVAGLYKKPVMAGPPLS